MSNIIAFPSSIAKRGVARGKGLPQYGDEFERLVGLLHTAKRPLIELASAAICALNAKIDRAETSRSSLPQGRGNDQISPAQAELDDRIPICRSAVLRLATALAEMQHSLAHVKNG